jgi:hypothetical protein
MPDKYCPTTLTLLFMQTLFAVTFAPWWPAIPLFFKPFFKTTVRAGFATDVPN